MNRFYTWIVLVSDLRVDAIISGLVKGGWQTSLLSADGRPCVGTATAMLSLDISHAEIDKAAGARDDVKKILEKIGIVYQFLIVTTGGCGAGWTGGNFELKSKELLKEIEE